MKTPSPLHRRKWLQLASLTTITGLASRFLHKSGPSGTEECPSTPMQELGPFEPMKAQMQADKDMDLTQIKGHVKSAMGERITIKGKVMDQNCQPIENAIVEVWQANHHGKYNHEYDTEGQDDPNFQGWGQVKTDNNGAYSLKSILPGLYGRRTRHIHYKVQCRGYHELVTQLYFKGESRNETDGIYNSLTHEEQNAVTIDLDETGVGSFNIYMQKVDTSKLPKKVLKAYVGNYKLSLDEESGMGKFLENSFGIKKEVIFAVTLKNNQLYLDASFINPTEIIWKSKDTFDSTYFYDSTLSFNRKDDGKITGFTIKMNDSPATFSADRVS